MVKEAIVASLVTMLNVGTQSPEPQRDKTQDTEKQYAILTKEVEFVDDEEEEISD